MATVSEYKLWFNNIMKDDYNILKKQAEDGQS